MGELLGYLLGGLLGDLGGSLVGLRLRPAVATAEASEDCGRMWTTAKTVQSVRTVKSVKRLARPWEALLGIPRLLAGRVW